MTVKEKNQYRDRAKVQPSLGIAQIQLELRKAHHEGKDMRSGVTTMFKCNVARGRLGAKALACYRTKLTMFCY